MSWMLMEGRLRWKARKGRGRRSISRSRSTGQRLKMDRRRLVAPAQASDEEAWIAKTVSPCSELRLDHTTSLKCATPKLVPFLASRERTANIDIASQGLDALARQVWCP